MTYVLPAGDADLVSCGRMGATRTFRADDENLDLFVHSASIKNKKNPTIACGLVDFRATTLPLFT
jgi:hypothetical protein